MANEETTEANKKAEVYSTILVAFVLFLMAACVFRTIGCVEKRDAIEAAKVGIGRVAHD